jgi:hypothetical protein
MALLLERIVCLYFFSVFSVFKMWTFHFDENSLSYAHELVDSGTTESLTGSPSSLVGLLRFCITLDN